MSKKKVSFTTQGFRADIGPYQIHRLLSNRYVEMVGPFIFLDHVLPLKHSPGELPRKANGKGAHPHRGIATLTYLLKGQAVHLDSNGHYALVKSGGAQWMKAGNGIIHDEVVNVDPDTGDDVTHGFQFWVNLPAKNKAEKPDYLPVQASEMPVKSLPDGAGWIKVIAGKYEELASRIPEYLKQFIYHIHLEPGKKFTLDTDSGMEYAAVLPLNSATINDREYKTGELIGFEKGNGLIELSNTSKNATDIILFGGEPYTEPVLAQGPFVMSTEHEISQAYNDFYNGKYGEIQYGLAEKH